MSGQSLEMTTKPSVTTEDELNDEKPKRDKGSLGLILLLGILSITTVLLVFGLLYFYNQYNACANTNLIFCPPLSCADGSNPTTQASLAVDEALQGNGYVLPQTPVTPS
jgi:hypothetical protein